MSQITVRSVAYQIDGEPYESRVALMPTIRARVRAC
jgi:hypothetical protein